MKTFSAIVLAALLASGVHGQQVVLAGMPATALHAGMEVPMRTSEGLSTEGKHLKVGQRFALETTEPLSLNGKVVIPSGAHGVGEVTSVRNKGMWGKSGNIEARILYLRAGDRQVRLSGTINDKGVTGTASVVGAAVLLPIAGFLLTGTSARIPSGTPVKAFLDEDVPVSFVSGNEPVPLVVDGSAGSADTVVRSNRATVAGVVDRNARDPQLVRSGSRTPS